MTASPVRLSGVEAGERGRAGSMSVETVRFDRTAAVIKVSGELDLQTAAPLWAVLRSHLGAGRRFLRLDVSGVTFLDATALAGITGVHKELLSRRGTLVITGVRALVSRVLRMTGLDEVLFVGGTRADDDVITGVDAADLEALIEVCPPPVTGAPADADGTDATAGETA